LVDRSGRTTPFEPVVVVETLSKTGAKPGFETGVIRIGIDLPGASRGATCHRGVRRPPVQSRMGPPLPVLPRLDRLGRRREQRLQSLLRAVQRRLVVLRQLLDGLEVRLDHLARLEARDFYSGIPDYDVDTGRSRQHNYYVGVGVIYRF